MLLIFSLATLVYLRCNFTLPENKLMIFRRFIIQAVFLSLLLARAADGHAQLFSNYNPDEDYFNHEVKIIDEFIERFNNDSATFLRKVYEKKGKPFNISRTLLLVSLFDLENPSFTDKNSDVKAFFDDVLDTNHPVYLSFNDSDWYAAAQSIFLYNGKAVEIPLVLHVKSKGDEWSKWMITGIGDTVPSVNTSSSIFVKKVAGKEAVKYISTSAYATNFIELHYVFSENMEPEYFFEPQLLASGNGRQFVDWIKSGQLKFMYVKDITFHFCQVNNWVFTVNKFNRKTFNNGWLISNIKKTNKAEKDAYLKRLLNQ